MYWKWRQTVVNNMWGRLRCNVYVNEEDVLRLRSFFGARRIMHKAETSSGPSICTVAISFANLIYTAYIIQNH